MWKHVKYKDQETWSAPVFNKGDVELDWSTRSSQRSGVTQPECGWHHHNLHNTWCHLQSSPTHYTLISHDRFWSTKRKKTAEVLICICCHNGSQMEVWGTWAGPWITISGPMKRFWTTICYNYVFCLVFLSCLFIQIKQLCKCLLTFNYDLANFSASYFDHVTFFAFRFIFFSEKKNPGIIFFTFFF